MNKEKQEAWEVQQRIGELEHTRDSLASQNATLRRERDAAIRSGYESQEEATTLRNELAAKQAEVEELKGVLHSVEDRLGEIQTDSSIPQAESIAKERELLRLKEEVSTLRGGHDIALQFTQQLSSENTSLRQQVTVLSGAEEERDELREQNRYLSSRNKLLKSQVGNFMVGSERVGISYYVLQVMSNIPILGSLIRRTSEEVYDAHQKPANK